MIKINTKKIKSFFLKIFKITSIYDFGNEYLQSTFKKCSIIILSLISPTWLYSVKAKNGLTPEEREKGIIGRNYSYLFVSIVFTFMIGLLFRKNPLATVAIGWQILTILFLYCIIWSRCNEILFAFINDALDKSEIKDKMSTLSYRKRIELALLSYIELILNYAILYAFMPMGWISNGGINSIVDAVYLSGVTITTLGYGDLSPVHWIPKVLVLHEVLAGFTLIIVSFAVYVGRSPEEGA